MTTDEPGRRTSGFRVHAPLREAREALRERVDVLDRTETLAPASADGRVLAEPVASHRDVPHYRRAAMDGYAVRSADVAGASASAPAVLSVVEGGDGGGGDGFEPGAAVRVHTGSAVPDGADAVVPVERVDRVGDGEEGEEDEEEVETEIEIEEPVAPGEHVAPVGEDVEAGQALYEPGHRLRPSDLGMLTAAGVDEVAVRARPTVGVVPTGEELVDADELVERHGRSGRDLEPGRTVETNGLTVSKLVARWGGRAEHREVVGDDPDALRAAIQRDLTRDVVVTTGGSSVGERDLLPEVVDELGEVLVHGVAIQPGHPVAVGVVEDTPVLVLPGYPVSCIVTAVQFLRPLLHWLAGTPVEEPPTRPATLSRKLDSEPGTRTFARVALEYEDGRRVARPTRARGAGVLSSVALADGWLEVEETVEGLDEGELVAVQDWEWSP